MALTDEYLRGIEEHELPELRRQVARLEAGALRLSERHGAGPWVEATHQWIDHLKKTIGIYETILSKYRRYASR